MGPAGAVRGLQGQTQAGARLRTHGRVTTSPLLAAHPGLVRLQAVDAHQTGSGSAVALAAEAELVIGKPSCARRQLQRHHAMGMRSHRKQDTSL